MSEITKKRPPAKTENTVKYLCLYPIIFLEICGITKPTKPIIPVRETIIDVRRVDNIIRNSFIQPVLIPYAFALLSPISNMSNS